MAWRSPTGWRTPETLVNDRPASFGGYAPQNFDGRFRGPVSVREALQLSLNLPVVEMTNTLGPARLMAALRRAGVATALDGPPGLAVALGGVGLSLDGLVQLYAGIARGGAAVALQSTPGPVQSGAQVIGGRSRLAFGADLGACPRARAHLPGWPLAFQDRHILWAPRRNGPWALTAATLPASGLAAPMARPCPAHSGWMPQPPVLFEAFARLGPRPEPLPPAPAGHAGCGAFPAARAPAPLSARNWPWMPMRRNWPSRPKAPAALRPVGGRVLARVDRGPRALYMVRQWRACADPQP